MIRIIRFKSFDLSHSIQSISGFDLEGENQNINGLDQSL